MRIVLSILLFLLSSNILAMNIGTKWNRTSFEKEVLVGCSESESYLCIDLCNNEKSCSVTEGYCRDCAGDNLFLKTLFKQLGRTYKNTSVEVSKDDFVSYLKEGDFVTISSKSIYNTIDKFNSSKLKERFRSLCKLPTEYPIVFLDVEHVSRTPIKVKYVTCENEDFNSDVYKMKRVYDVEVSI